MSDVDNGYSLEALNDLAPAFMHKLLDRAMKEENFDFDREGMILTGEINASSTIVKTSLIRRENSLWGWIKDEIFDCICSASSAYADVREQARDIIVLVVRALVLKIGLADDVISGMVTLAVIGVLKSSKNVWCKKEAEKRIANPQSGS
ncbi:hypothetical protein [Pseudomonas amygdali]|uniref:hypothetical protein n=1 Tax=Pseudomonas amygdali TaxID=47877 RepID=UPI0007106F52|nr:hypothetical protein [Pseudomonas amygdali]